MSLREKLSQQSQELEEAKRKARLEEERVQQEQENLKKAEEEKARLELEQQKFADEEKALESIRAHIQEIESEKYQLELIKGSLDVKSNKSDGVGKGMKEYAVDTANEVKDESNTLDSLINEHKEVLETAGVENRDQLIENPDFAAEPEVINYKNAVENVEALSVADGSLQKKLETLGVPINEETFSYEDVEKSITEKLETLETDLLKEKVKTPEGKEEAIEKIAEQLQADIPKSSLKKDKGNYTFEFIEKVQYIHDKKNAFILNSKGELIPENSPGVTGLPYIPEKLKEVEELYGKEIAIAAVKKAYEQNIEATFERYDNDNEHAKSILNDLENNNPGKAWPAHLAYNEFAQKNGNFYKEVWEKYDALRPQFKINSEDLDARAVVDLAKLGTDDKETEKVLKLINNADTFPPVLNWDKLKEKINIRTAQNEEFMNALSNIKTQEEFDHFLDWGHNSTVVKPKVEGTFGYRYRQMRDQSNFFNVNEYDKRQSVIDPKFKFNHITTTYGHDAKLEELGRKFNSYTGAIRFYEKEIEDLETIKTKIIEKVDQGIEKELLTEKLAQELKKNEEFASSIYEIERSIQRIEDDKENALEIMGKLVSIEGKIADDEIVDFSRNEFRVRSIDKEIDTKRKLLEEKDAELKAKTRELAIKQNSKPGIFGSTSKWQKEIEILEAERKELEETVTTIGRVELKDLYDKQSIQIKFSNSYSRAYNMLENEKLSGTKQEVFEKIRATLTEIINKQPPEEIVKLYEEYKKNQSS